MPGTKMYILNSLDLVAAVQRQPKTLAFPPIEAAMGKLLSGWSDEADKIVNTNVNGDEGDWGISMDTYREMKKALAPGPHLDQMNRTMLQIVAASLESLRVPKSDSKEINLMSWIRHELTMATTYSVYGPQNPFADPVIQKAFW